MSKKSKYTRVDGWDDSEGFLSDQQIKALQADEKAMQLEEDACSKGEELQIISDEVIDFINEHVPRHKISKKYKGTKVFLK
ncbi:TPA: hypothetical protein ACNV18_000840 [Pseudomonas putida]|uniref:hypothetical protein n=1 Tax=Pseudomonas sp. MB-090624 TaxID=2213078 RepID=UPI000D9B8552|nr:hypothetical protein [Pseudomonas sp. MB-090624]PYB99970.1 hypothetical protein DMX12_14270 [Pseudomonas sp. MB-090624]